MQSRFKFDDSVYTLTEMLVPANARKKKPNSLADLFLRFQSLRKVCDAVKADEEWRSQSKLNPGFFGCKDAREISQLSVEKYWQILMHLEIPNLNTPRRRFPNLSSCVALLLCLPASKFFCPSSLIEWRSSIYHAFHWKHCRGGTMASGVDTEWCDWAEDGWPARTSTACDLAGVARPEEELTNTGGSGGTVDC
ncbi:hypothetical protein OUZ56_017316 [Daphnia magna]|uniref:Uncharacterized protein n=1 Tax=Daphnia magna TaxID=35525 RepID=A0ABR0AT50_9CRUS|nr:hypothetical protein OUZ56_017316 [Daphnia magna]